MREGKRGIDRVLAAGKVDGLRFTDGALLVEWVDCAVLTMIFEAPVALAYLGVGNERRIAQVTQHPPTGALLAPSGSFLPAATHASRILMNVSTAAVTTSACRDGLTANAASALRNDFHIALVCSP